MRKILAVAAFAAATLACTDSTSPVSRPLSLNVAASVGVAAPAEAVLPSGYTSMMGGTNTNFPHASFRMMRYQQVFLGSDVVHPVIIGLCLRRDDISTGPSREKTLAIKLGPTTLDHTNFGAVFETNYSAPPTEVFSGNVTLPASSGLEAGTPADFDICIPFTQSYEHPAGSNLILEVVNTSLNLGTNPRDACGPGEAACTTAKAWVLSPTASTASTVEPGGLIVKLVSPEPPAPVNPVSHEDCMKGGWSNFEFRNQGQCIRFVETGMDSRVPLEPE